MDERARADQARPLRTRQDRTPHMSTPSVQQRDRVIIRFAGDSGDGMQLTGGQFTLSTALAGKSVCFTGAQPRKRSVLEKMIAENDRTGLTVIALMEVDPDHIHLYGVASVEETDDPDVVKVTGLVEKPKKEDAQAE